MDVRVVLDTSTLQSLWRGGVFDRLSGIFSRIALPRSVADETRWSRFITGEVLVPDVDAHTFLHVQVVPEDSLRSLATQLFQARHRSKWKGDAPPTPQVALVEGKVRVWIDKRMQLSYSIPELEVVALAKQIDAVALVDDRKALRAAKDFAVKTLTTRETIARLIKAKLVTDAQAVLRRIEATGYYPTRRLQS